MKKEMKCPYCGSLMRKNGPGIGAKQVEYQRYVCTYKECAHNWTNTREPYRRNGKGKG